MSARKLRKYLDENSVKYINIAHSTAYTAQEIAACSHVSGRNMAKTVIILLKGKMAMAVLPASLTIDFSHLEDALGVDQAELATEEEFKDQFPDCELGAMPPFGNLYGMEVVVTESLAENDEIVFNAGTHRDLIKMKFKDFEKLVNPKRARFEGKLIC